MYLLHLECTGLVWVSLCSSQLTLQISHPLPTPLQLSMRGREECLCVGSGVWSGCVCGCVWIAYIHTVYAIWSNNTCMGAQSIAIITLQNSDNLCSGNQLFLSGVNSTPHTHTHLPLFCLPTDECHDLPLCTRCLTDPLLYRSSTWHASCWLDASTSPQRPSAWESASYD